MPSGRISKRTVDALQCAATTDRVFLWDDALAGFGVCAMRSGKKSYVVQFRRNGRSSRVVLGVHGRLTPDEARSIAKKLLGSVESGADPIEDRRAARAVKTLREVASDFMELHIEAKRKARTKDDYTVLLRRWSKRIRRSPRSDSCQTSRNTSKAKPRSWRRSGSINTESKSRASQMNDRMFIAKSRR